MDQELQYVLHSYQSGKLDTKNALISVRKRVGIQNHTVLRRWVAIAATLLVLVVGGSWVYLTRRITTLSADAVAQTYRLQDGTKVILSPHSSLSYRGWNNRKVEITGKVYLDIRHDATHPFEIQDCTYTIHDIGTCLQVEENGSATTVYVLHGAAYFASTRQPRNGVVLKEKMGAILSDGCDVPKQTFHRMANSASWATHEFHFDNTPLPEVLRDLSAYYHIRLLAPPTTQRLTGDFKADNLTEILDMIGQILNVKITIDSKHPDKVR